jgi:hypothetical protein
VSGIKKLCALNICAQYKNLCAMNIGAQHKKLCALNIGAHYKNLCALNIGVGPRPSFGEPLSCLAIFGTSIGWSKMECPGEAEITGSRPLLRVFWGIRVYVTGMGCRPMDLPMFRPHLYCINRYLGDVRKDRPSRISLVWI